MQVHTFIAESANEAVERIRTELGPAAVVLSVRKLPRSGLDRFIKQDQIEVLAGVDEPAQVELSVDRKQDDPLAELREEIRELRRQVSAPGIRDYGSGPTSKRAAIAQILSQTGILPPYIEQILQELPELDRLTAGEQIAGASEVLRARWRAAEAETPAAVHVFIGVPGCGKSSVLCKMLAQTSLVGREPATVYQLDSHVANPSPLPGVYAEIVGAEFERTNPMQFERREESVFVDLPGVALNDHTGLRRLRQTIAEFGIPEVHLVLNAAYETNHLLDQVRFFSSLGISDLILTHLDEEARWGKIWNLVLGTNFSIRFLCDGQNIPGDFHRATPDVVLGRQFRGK
jgi:flagellar biosynthesis protein FlhF